ncbi:MAG: PIN domain-containing protein [Burkholderiales bacterium]|nr:PIN domain-containing protein [Burkholderiales bacterium]
MNDAAAVSAVKDLLRHHGVISLVSHDRAAFERAALHRARHGLRMVDTLQLATAQGAGARCLVSNNRQFPQFSPTSRAQEDLCATIRAFFQRGESSRVARCSTKATLKRTDTCSAQHAPFEMAHHVWRQN